MAKKAKRAVKKEVENKVDLSGLKCYKKIGGGSMRFPNRIIKPGQKFWISPELIPAGFRDLLEEISADDSAVVVSSVSEHRVTPTGKDTLFLEKFRLEKATNEDGEVIKKGDSALYNVVGADDKPLNDQPLRKKKAEELLSTLNV